MTKTEFLAWSKHTERSRNGWQRDEVALHNRGELLMYHGGEAGTYVSVVGSTVTVGRYEGAVPHIGEAVFRVTGRKKFATESEAYQALLNATGTRGLLAAMGLPP